MQAFLSSNTWLFDGLSIVKAITLVHERIEVKLSHIWERVEP